MSDTISAAEVAKIYAQDAEKRYQYLLQQVQLTQQIWILMDEHGCVMLNSDEEDCVPIWPAEEFAKTWLTEEWKNCKLESISVAKWQSRWTTGLEEDELSIAIFPDHQGEGLVISPYEFDADLRAKNKKSR